MIGSLSYCIHSMVYSSVSIGSTGFVGLFPFIPNLEGRKEGGMQGRSEEGKMRLPGF